MYFLFRHRQPALSAFIAVFLFALNGTTLTLLYANDIMTELPFTCASFAALLYWQLRIAPSAVERSTWRVPWRTLLIAAVMLALPYYLRTVGVALMLAAMLMLLWYRRPRTAVILAALLAVLALPWAYFSSTAGQSNYLSKLLLRDPYNPSLDLPPAWANFCTAF